MTLEIFLNSYPAISIAGLFILGLCIGSFLNVVIYRLPKIMEAEWLAECQQLLDSTDGKSTRSEEAPSDKNSASFGLAFPASHCPGCKTPIKPWHNLPVISYLLLKGQCANCGVHISKRYPLIELTAGVIAVIVAWQLGLSYASLAAIALSWTLLTLTMIDIDHQLLPDQITLPLLWAGLIVNSFGLLVPLQDAVWGAIGGYLVLWTVYQLFKLVTGKEGMGFGDFKLLAALGAWMGWQMLPLIILLSSLVGAVLGVIILQLQKKGRGTPIPFGPYLAIAGWIALLWGDTLVAGYLRLAGLD